MRNLVLQQALSYVHDFGFSVIPITNNGTKKPMLRWEKYQNEHPTDKDLKAWFSDRNVNVGIVTGEISKLCVVDVDEYNPELPKYIPKSLYTPTVCTPRDGRHNYFSSPGFPVRNNQGRIKGVDFRGDGGYVVAPPSRNQDGSKYSWIIGIEEAPLSILPESYLSLLSEHAEPKYSITPATAFTKGRRDDDLFHISYCLAKGGMELDEMLVVMGIFARNCNPPFPEQEMIAKVNSAFKRARRIDVGVEIEDWLKTQGGVFDISDIYRDLQLVDRNDRKDATRKLLDMLEIGRIERDGKSGRFRIVEDECDSINWWDVSDEPLDISLPMGLNDLTYVLPKSIICVAGFSNSGKTALALDFIRLNMYRYEGRCHYFNSEMGRAELRERLRRFKNVQPMDWRKFNAYERSGNFADVIVPDGFNVIDYLEVNDEFWRVGHEIKLIHDKLTTGVALICLQKKAGARFGVGAEFGIHKPRLYLNMENGKAEIVKCKNFANPRVDPNGMSCFYRLIDGYEFHLLQPWRRK